MLLRILTAASEPGEVDHGVDLGELVYPSSTHDIVELGVLCPECLCSVSFTGLRSDRYTTVARAVEMDVEPGDLFREIVEHLGRVEERPAAELFEEALDVYGRVLLAGCNFQPGDLVYRAGNRLTSRQRPERGLSAPLDVP